MLDEPARRKQGVADVVVGEVRSIVGVGAALQEINEVPRVIFGRFLG